MRNAELIKILYECAAECNKCAGVCLDEKDVKIMVECIRMDLICATTCTATAQALSVNSEDVKGLIYFCWEICKKCANECAKHEVQRCIDCAEACKKCAEACDKYEPW